MFLFEQNRYFHAAILTLLSLSSGIPQTGQECIAGLAGESTSRCSILTCSSRSGAELNIFAHNGQGKTSPVQPPTDGDVKSKCRL